MKEYYARYDRSDGGYHERGYSKQEFVFNAENDKQARQIALAYAQSKRKDVVCDISYTLLDLRRIKQKKIKFDVHKRIPKEDLEKILEGVKFSNF